MYLRNNVDPHCNSFRCFWNGWLTAGMVGTSYVRIKVGEIPALNSLCGFISRQQVMYNGHSSARHRTCAAIGSGWQRLVALEATTNQGKGMRRRSDAHLIGDQRE